MNIGFIGLGRMGAGIAANLLAGGCKLVVHDANPRAVEGLASATMAASAADVAARVDRVFLCLPFAPEVHQVLFGDDGVATGASPGLPVVDCTTLVHSDTLEIAARAADAGLEYNDCPVSGGPAGAAAGTLTVMFGGSEQAFADNRALLQMFGHDVVHCGPLGSGQLMKAVNNVIYDVNIAALAEILPLAARAGLDPDTLVSVVTSGSSRSYASDHFAERMLERRFEGDFPMAAAWKDIVNVQQIAVHHGAMTPVMNAMTAIYQTAIARGHGQQAKSAMIHVYEDVLGRAFARAGHDEDAT